MARQTVTIEKVFCDICGAELGEDAPDPLAVSIDSTSYRADLCRRHHEQRSKLLERAVDELPPVRPRASGRGRSRRGQRGGSRRDLAAVREWARAQGYEVSDRGRIPQAILEAYDAG